MGSNNSVAIVGLKQIDSQVFLRQNGFIWEQRILIWGFRPNGEPHPSPEKQRRGMLVYGFGRGCYMSPLEGTESSKYSDFSRLNYGFLPLAELLLDKEESFLPPAQVIK